MKKKKELVVATVALTTIMLMAAVSYSCSRHVDEDIDSTGNEYVAEEQIESKDVIVSSYKNEIELNVGETLTLDMLEIDIGTDLDVTYDFTEKTYDTVGEFEEVIIVRASSIELSDELRVKVTVVDNVSPEIIGAKDIIVMEGQAIDLLAGVTAKDNADGDLTSKITVSEYDATLLDKNQIVSYSVTDGSGNTTTVEITLHIKSDPIEVLDKIMYAISSVNVRDSSSANGNKLGMLSFAQEVHVTGRDKNTGWYRIDYNGGSAWVSDSYLSDTKPYVPVPDNNPPSPPSGGEDTNCNCNCNCDCDCNCSSNCDCVAPDCSDCSWNSEVSVVNCGGW